MHRTAYRSVKSVQWVGAWCLLSTEGRIWWMELFWGWKRRTSEWQMVRVVSVVMMTLARWDDRGGVMNQEEADQDVADEVSETVDSRGEVMRSKQKTIRNTPFTRSMKTRRRLTWECASRPSEFLHNNNLELRALMCHVPAVPGNSHVNVEVRSFNRFKAVGI